MTDRELLELAAKAAGYDVKPHGNNRISKYLIFTHRGGNWNPLTDDGDALRLAVKLHLCITTDKDGCSITEHKVDSTINEDSADVYTATRRAIVRAAAEIGKAMP